MSDETRAPLSLHPDNPELGEDAEAPEPADQDWDDVLPDPPPPKPPKGDGHPGSFDQGIDRGPGGLYGDERGGQRPKGGLYGNESGGQRPKKRP